MMTMATTTTTTTVIELKGDVGMGPVSLWPQLF